MSIIIIVEIYCQYEARYIRVWRQARGLSGVSMIIGFLLEEVMHWYNQFYGFSRSIGMPLQIHCICSLVLGKPSEWFHVVVFSHDCRDVRNVCGFTREVLIADIETREWRHREKLT